jgi:spore coat polysaccharide biosynthesis predicted glycosyltransferase SpsG/RimJ/RimL family protein N-acetyltransferase
VVDGYAFAEAFLSCLRDEGMRILLIADDAQAGYQHAHLVLNHNIYAEASRYPALADQGRLLLGPQYALLRQEFLDWTLWERKIPQSAKRLVITMGGGDVENLTGRILAMLLPHPVADLEVKVGLGDAFRHAASVQALERPSRVALLSSPPDMAAVFAEADLAMTAGGGTCLESAFMGLPSLLIPFAENQRPVAEGFHRRGVAIDLGWHEQIDWVHLPEKILDLSEDAQARRRMSSLGRRLVDGRGARRIAALLSSQPLAMKPAGWEDAKRVWEWANDPHLRSQSFAPEPIAWEQHVTWFDQKLVDGRTVILIGSAHPEGPVGHVRFEVENAGEAAISIIVDARHRGRGFGLHLVQQGIQHMRWLYAIEVFHAWAHGQNTASQATFEKAGFRLVEKKLIHGRAFHHYKLS